MPQGYSLHIGLNGVDATQYHGWNGALSGCVNDANAMQKICSSQGFATRCLLNGDATASALLGAISTLAGAAKNGDTVVISYSGHGGQIPDTTGTSDDGLDDTWVSYDRMVAGKELYGLWSSFADGVHIEVYSDSCHSGTVIRELLLTDGLPAAPARTASAVGTRARTVPTIRGTTNVDPTMAAYTTVFGALAKERSAATTILQTADAGALNAFPRAIPPDLALQLFHEQQAMFARIPRPGPINCGVLLISACQSNQVAQDGDVNGLFTEKLLQVWDSGNFSGTLPQFHKAILALMPPTETPNYFLVGIDDDAFTNGRPLTVLNAGTVSPVAPAISGPATCPRDGGPPTFTITPGSNTYYVVEVATDTGCFGDSSKRTASNFFGSWNDGSRLTDATYALPQSAWDALKAADCLFYRAGSTSSQTGWDNYLVSTPDDKASSAPSISITAAADTSTTTDTSGTTTTTTPAAPTITAPATYARSNTDGPTFSVSTSAPYFVVEVATDPSLFANSGARTDTTFYGSWNDGSVASRLTGTSFTMPSAAWAKLNAADSLAYRAGSTTSATGWDNYAVSTTDADAATAPTIGITADGGRGAPAYTKRAATSV